MRGFGNCPNAGALDVAVLALALLSVGAANAGPILVDADVPIERGFVREGVVSGLEHPWGMDWLPGGDLLVTERPGRLRLVEVSADGRWTLRPKPVPGVPPVFDRGQGGLLDISLHPNFAENRLVYFSYSHGTELTNRTRVARAVYERARITDWEVIFETNLAKPGGQHFGSRFCWLPDGTLLVSVGDGGNPPLQLDDRLIRENAQDLTNELGSLVRINDDGSVPTDNPFKNRQGGRIRIFSYGHRNIQGLAYDAMRKVIWATEHGALGGDELNQPRPGRNYGWPAVTYSREYFDGSRISSHVSKPGFEPPLVVWLSAIAPSGLTLYTGSRFPEWRGDLFAGSLIKQSVRHIALDDNGKVTGERELRFGARVRDVRQGPDGYLYVLTDEKNGDLLRLKPIRGGDTAP
jgi:glucose/arabinose dehydrogenase